MYIPISDNEMKSQLEFFHFNCQLFSEAQWWTAFGVTVRQTKSFNWKQKSSIFPLCYVTMHTSGCIFHAYLSCSLRRHKSVSNIFLLCKYIYKRMLSPTLSTLLFNSRTAIAGLLLAFSWFFTIQRICYNSKNLNCIGALSFF